MSRVAAIHHSLGHVDAGPSYVGAFGQVYHTTDRSTVNAHPNLQARVVLGCAASLESAFDRCFGTVVKNPRHPVAGGNCNQSARLFRSLELLRATNNSVQRVEQRALLINHQLGVTDDVDEQDMGDFELDLFLDLGRHVPMRFIHILRCPIEEIKIDNRTLRGVARYQPVPREGSSMSVILPKINQNGEAIPPATRSGDSSGDENSSQRLREAPFCFGIFLPATRSRIARRNFSRIV